MGRNQRMPLTYTENNQLPVIAVNANKQEVIDYLDFLENTKEIADFLNYDCCFRLADNFLLAVVFVYLKKTGFIVVNDNALTPVNFFTALLLAHAVVEEDDSLLPEIYYYALFGMIEEKFIKRFEQMKLLMIEKMDFRARISFENCVQIMSLVPHDLWERKRDSLHAGAAREYFRDSTVISQSNPTYDYFSSTCYKCRKARAELLKDCGKA